MELLTRKNQFNDKTDVCNLLDMYLQFYRNRPAIEPRNWVLQNIIEDHSGIFIRENLQEYKCIGHVHTYISFPALITTRKLILKEIFVKDCRRIGISPKIIREICIFAASIGISKIVLE